METRSVPETRPVEKTIPIPTAPRSPSPPVEDSSILPTTTVSEYVCSQCSLKFKESWNRCPKCGGDVKPVVLDQPEDMKKHSPDTPPGGLILPHHPVPGGHPGSPIPGGPAPLPPQAPVPQSTQQTSSVKKIRKVRRAKDTSGQASVPGGHPRSTPGRIGTDPNSHRSPHQSHPRSPQSAQTGKGSSPGKSRSSPITRIPPTRGTQPGKSTQAQTDINALFDADPELDDPNAKVRRPQKGRKSAPKGSWKSVPTIAEPTSHPYSPPPEVKSMLSSLMDTGDIDLKDQSGGGVRQADDGGCPKCGYTNPPGSWEFCMKCGNRC